MFQGPVGDPFSFDCCGVFDHPERAAEVFIELKGHRDGGKVLDGYKDFLVKAYAVSMAYSRHRNDLFWFVTNVPFGARIGKALTSPEYINSVLGEDRGQRASKILGRLSIDPEYAAHLSERVSVCVLTDSYMKIAGVSHKIKHGETIWSITKLLHGGRIPFAFFEPIKQVVAALNDLESADKIKAGKRIVMPWYGLNWGGVETTTTI